MGNLWAYARAWGAPGPWEGAEGRSEAKGRVQAYAQGWRKWAIVGFVPLR